MATYVAPQEQQGIVDVRAKRINGFSLMEMMVVLLIVAIIAAASAPMVTKKLSRNAETGDSPWVFTGLNNNIAYNMSGNTDSAVIIGAADVKRTNGQPIPKLYIESSGDEPQLGFGSSGANGYVSLLFDRNNRRVGFSDAATISRASVALGAGQKNDSNNGFGSVSIGDSTYIHENTSESIAIGQNAHVEGQYCIAIGTKTAARTLEGSAIAIGGNETYVYGKDSIGIGLAASTRSNAEGGVALGTISSAYSTNSVAIGSETNASKEDQIVLGNDDVSEIRLGGPNTTVYIRGNLIVEKDVILNRVASTHTALHPWGKSPDGPWLVATENQGRELNGEKSVSSGGSIRTLWNKYTSDRRLKDVKDKYTGGLAELKKLDIFHYTFKNDDKKTPHVGVMVQDLQKVFPDAVTKGEDGYLQIRFEDMFYAVINAVKELDNKIAEIVQNITDMRSTIVKQAEINEEQSKTIAEQQKTIEQQQKAIEEQQQLIKNLEKRIEKLED